MVQTPPAMEQAEEDGATEGTVGPDTGTTRTAELTFRRLASATRATTDHVKVITAMPVCCFLSDEAAARLFMAGDGRNFAGQFRKLCGVLLQIMLKIEDRARAGLLIDPGRGHSVLLTFIMRAHAHSQTHTHPPS